MWRVWQRAPLIKCVSTTYHHLRGRLVDEPQCLCGPTAAWTSKALQGCWEPARISKSWVSSWFEICNMLKQQVLLSVYCVSLYLYFKEIRYNAASYNQYMRFLHWNITITQGWKEHLWDLQPRCPWKPWQSTNKWTPRYCLGASGGPLEATSDFLGPMSPMTKKQCECGSKIILDPMLGGISWYFGGISWYFGGISWYIYNYDDLKLIKILRMDSSLGKGQNLRACRASTKLHTDGTRDSHTLGWGMPLTSSKAPTATQRKNG